MLNRRPLVPARPTHCHLRCAPGSTRLRLEQLEERATPAVLVAAYAFAEGTGATVADASGNSNTGTTGGATWTTAGKYGNALSFNGSNARVNVVDSPSLHLTTGMTLEAWVNPTVVNSGWRDVIYKGNDNYYLMATSSNAGRPVGGIIAGGTYSETIGTATLANNTWTHLATTYDGANLRLYVNGVQASSVAKTGAILSSTNPLQIGGDSIYGQYFSGLIDEVRIYDGALTQAQIQADMNAPVQTGPDTTPPTVSAVSPSAGATGVAYASNVTITFTEAMDPATISGATVQLRDAGANLVAASVAYDAATRTATLDPTANLNPAATYSAVVRGGASDPRAKDLAGNALAGDFTWTFTTAPVSLAVSDTTVVEGNSGTVNAVFSVTLSAASAQVVTVSYATASGTATAGSDYLTVLPTVLTFDPGQTVKSVTVAVLGDTVSESNESFYLNLSGPTNAVLADAQGVGTIIDDDAALIGSEGFGYTAYTHPGEALDPVPGAAGVTTIRSNGDNNTNTINLASGNTFNFYGTSYTSLIVSTNGLITFGTANSSAANADLTASPSQRAIAPLWDDWTNTSGNAMLLQKYEDINGDGANDRLIVEWNNVQGAPSSPSPVTFQAILQLNTGTTPGAITFNYPDLDAGNALTNGGSATVGIKDSGTQGTRRLLVSFNSSSSPYVGSGKAIRIVPDTTAPSVAISAPAAGSTVSGTINVAATAVDNIAVAGVQFKLDGTDLGTEDTTAPYSVSWNTTTATPGVHTLAAVARDTSGNTATSALVTVSVIDTTPPSVSLTAPANNATVQGTITVSAAASDNVAVVGVQFTLDGVNLGSEDSTAPYSISWDTATAAPGGHLLTAVARDAAGNTAVSGAVAVTVVVPDTTPPTVSITAPPSGATVSGTIAVSADAADNAAVAGVQFLLDGNNLGTEDTVAPYSISWDTTSISNGTHVLGARARDASGNSATAGTVSLTVSNAAPSGLVLALGMNEGVGSLVADVSGKGNSGTVAGATWAPGKYSAGLSFNGVTSRVDIADSVSLDLTTGMTLEAWVNPVTIDNSWRDVIYKGDDIYFLMASSTSNSQAAAGAKVGAANLETFGVSNLPVNTWTHLAATYDGANLRLYVNGGLVSTAARSGTLLTSNSPLQIGGDSVYGQYFTGLIDEVRVYNRALTAAEVTADMLNPIGTTGSTDPNPPDVHLDQPADGALVNDIVVVAATATDDIAVAGVQFLVDGVPTGALDTTAPYALTWDTRTVSNGAHTLTARAYDTSGNTAASQPVTVNVSNTSFFRNVILATGFNLPTAIKFLPDGRMLVAELTGAIKVLPPPYTSVDPNPFLELNLNIGGYEGLQQGIFDFALDPAFQTNHFYYVFYTNDNPNRDRLSRFTANATLDGTIGGSEVILYEDPLTPNTEHHGGAINFGNDGKLYFTTGEHFDAARAQDLTSPRGKIHRVNPDGTVPTDNPFYDGAGPNWDSIWAYGLRNPYRAYYDAPTGRLFIGDVGGNDYSTAKEEVNVGARGANYGWPNVEGASSNPAYTDPIYFYPHNGRDASVTGGFVYRGTQFPSGYQGSYFFADYTQNWIRRLTFDSNGAVTGVFNFEPADGSVDGPYGDIVYLTEGPEGALYYVDLGYSDVGGTFGVSKIRRIEFVQSNLPPVVAASAAPVGGSGTLTFAFSSAGSADPEGLPLTYLWDFGDGQTSALPNPQHTYARAGLYQARLTVSDGFTPTLSPPLAISAGNKPVATLFTTPADGGLFRAGDVIVYSGQATDVEDGPLPASAFTWNIDFLHEGHVHPGNAITGVTGGSFPVPTSGHDFSGFTRYRITLTVTDSDGLQSTQSATVFPEKVDLSFDTVPAGLTLYLDGIAHLAPFVYDTLVGFTHTIEARDQSVSTSAYAFASWSDGGAQSHQIVVPTANRSYLATFQAVQNTGLVAAYSFNEGTGTAVADGSGNGNSGVTSNTTWTTAGKFGTALSFNGTSSLVTIADANSLDLTTGMTLEAWVNPSTISSTWRDVVYKGPNDIYYLEGTSSQGPPAVGGTFSGNPLYSNASLPANTWAHLAATYDGAALRLYVNGTQVAIRSQTGSIATSNGALTIGGDTLYGQRWVGLIDEVRIYNRALSVTEIQADMNTPVGSPLQLLGPVTRSAAAASLLPADVQPLFDEAVVRWQSAWDNAFVTRRLQNTRVEIVDLPGPLLGMASGSVIFLDADAAGSGWFLDSTPWEDSEFAAGRSDGLIAGRADLLSVLAHELGHLLGKSHLADRHAHPHNVMDEFLPLGARHIEVEDAGQPISSLDAVWAIFENDSGVFFGNRKLRRS